MSQVLQCTQFEKSMRSFWNLPVLSSEHSPFKRRFSFAAKCLITDLGRSRLRGSLAAVLLGMHVSGASFISI